MHSGDRTTRQFKVALLQYLIVISLFHLLAVLYIISHRKYSRPIYQLDTIPDQQQFYVCGWALHLDCVAV